jgi:hypothetical protein
MESALSCHISQGIGDSPVDITAAIQFTPTALGGSQHTRAHSIGDNSTKLYPAPAVFHDHLLPMPNPPARRILRMDLHKRSAFMPKQISLVGEAAGGEVVGGTGDEVERLAGGETAI